VKKLLLTKPITIIRQITPKFAYKLSTYVLIKFKVTLNKILKCVNIKC
jgi:hypothetical protein